MFGKIRPSVAKINVKGYCKIEHDFVNMTLKNKLS